MRDIVLIAFVWFAAHTYTLFYVGDSYPYPTAFGLWGERCMDYTTYTRAALGDMEYERTLHRVRGWHPDFPIGWLYWNPLRFLWYPFALLPERTGHLLWYCIQCLSMCYVYSKLCGVPNGWLIAVASFKIVQVHCLNGGNIAPILLALMLTPLGAIVAGIFKPHLWTVALLHGVLRFNRSLAARVHGGFVAPLPTSAYHPRAPWVALANRINRAVSAVHLRILGR